jgi:tetratricopeptide (TPR) repeat protein
VTHRAAFVAALAVWAGVLGCFSRGPTQAPSVLAGNVLAGELELARQELARGEYDEAAARLDRLVRALPATDPIGAEARAVAARVQFDLGAYANALALARQVPSGGRGGTEALEIRGITELFTCAFDGAAKDLWSLADYDEATSLTWLGVLDAWLGRDADAERRLADVARRFGASEEAPLARFYLLQLYLWAGRQAQAVQTATELDAASPGYLASLRTRAENWVQRSTHLMRAFFTFDTLSRLADARGDFPQATADNDLASTALAGLERAGGGCATQVPRLRAAWDGWATVLASNAPVLDRDGDGIVDAEDECPDEPETWNGVADDDGCPDSAAIEVRGNQILVSSGFAIYFATDSDQMLPTPSLPTCVRHLPPLVIV